MKEMIRVTRDSHREMHVGDSLGQVGGKVSLRRGALG